MLSVLLVSALLAGPQGDAPALQRPVFHAEAYVVVCPNTFWFGDLVGGPSNSPNDGHLKPSHGLTSDDFQAFVNKEPLAVNVSEDPKQPGSYILSVNPPADLRDGKSHQIVVWVKKYSPKPDQDVWHEMHLKWTAKFPKPPVGL